MAPRITTEYARRGIDIVILENDHLRVEVLAGKGGDVTEIRDKRTDVNVLFETPHEWHAPGDGYVGSPDENFVYLDHYPGGWQDVLPAAGGPTEVRGALFGLHGETPIAPWDATVTRDTDEAVAVELAIDLSRYPFRVERELSLRAGESILRVDETVENRGAVEVEYSWLQHLAFGRPLVGPRASLDVPCETVIVDPDHDSPNRRFYPGERFAWPTYADGETGTVDLRSFPDFGEPVHDLAALCDLSAGYYRLENPGIDLAATVRFPHDLYEYVWYWGAFGGFEAAPFFGRNYNVGLEPCTSIPDAGLHRAIENGTANRLDPGETVSATIEVETERAK